MTINKVDVAIWFGSYGYGNKKNPMGMICILKEKKTTKLIDDYGYFSLKQLPSTKSKKELCDS